MINIATNQVISFILVFCRIGLAISLMPGIGDKITPAIVRLVFALVVSYYTFFTGDAFEANTQFNFDSSIYILIFEEIAIGICIGLTVKILMHALHIAGMIIANQISLSAAVMFDPTHGEQSSIIGNMLSIIALVLIFNYGFHIFFIESINFSYKSLPIGSFFQNKDDMMEMIIKIFIHSWNIAMRIASPFIVSGISIYIGIGVLARLMPQLQVFFLALPLQLLFGIFLISVVTTDLITSFIEEHWKIISDIFN
ncbi:MAG: flagellar biosynthetic protein FliR [Proteobacteria bacterium]|nr:flagellar biosynthetic protein FliR [Pseudomonadota bacterium]